MTRATASQLLDAAQRLVQQRGFNAFSYKDLATAVGIRTASIHYHFPAKADLGQALMARYRADLDAALADIDTRQRTQRSRLRAFIGLYKATQDEGAICLCGSLASDLATLPETIHGEVASYLETSEGWLRARLEDGVAAGEFRLGTSAARTAASLLASLQGALILARAQGDGTQALRDVEATFLASLLEA